MYKSISKNIQWNKKSNFWYQGRTQGGGNASHPRRKQKREKEKRKKKKERKREKRGKLIKKIS